VQNETEARPQVRSIAMLYDIINVAFEFGFAFLKAVGGV
jgi:hypothetical protein